ncbi:MAG: SDR family oxidoreductase [Porticoccaceae bacterium]|jgi:NAD(P)-dependent dehydrogenase (short-subunit alcohol dehydrogenase family)|nr:SDR family oxidoreductase [Porticoccaceae bacterium]
MATILITGTNKGIGLQLCSQLSERGDEVIALCRTASPELKALGIRVIEGIDIGDSASVSKLKAELGDQHLDVLINNAGILRGDSFGSLDYEEMLEQYRVNTLGPLMITEALVGNLSDGSKVAIVSSRVGSIDDNGSGGMYGYRASKTAVNMVGTNLKYELEPRGISIVLLHPGMVATEMTGGRGISPSDSASGLIERIDELSMESSGTFMHAEGYQLPW